VFRPCIDLHDGRVKQIVGGSLGTAEGLRTNFVADQGPAWFAARYRDDGLDGGHVIMLGSGNELVARQALAAYPGGLQVGGGINAGNAARWLDAGASHVIVTSWLFPEGELDDERVRALHRAVGRDRLVIDLSCRRREGDHVVVVDRWRRFTTTVLDEDGLARMADRCAELLVHAVDVEGLQAGIDEDLVERLAAWSPVPTTYAGGARTLADLERVDEVSGGRVDLTIGSALDLFGGTGVRYEDAVAFNARRRRAVPSAEG
jgi:phosphoribosylformimino-5-aminoimidazole carboxamide ribotide isomerase